MFVLCYVWLNENISSRKKVEFNIKTRWQNLYNLKTKSLFEYDFWQKKQRFIKTTSTTATHTYLYHQKISLHVQTCKMYYVECGDVERHKEIHTGVYLFVFLNYLFSVWCRGSGSHSWFSFIQLCTFTIIKLTVTAVKKQTHKQHIWKTHIWRNFSPKTLFQFHSYKKILFFFFEKAPFLIIWFSIAFRVPRGQKQNKANTNKWMSKKIVFLIRKFLRLFSCLTICIKMVLCSYKAL